MQLIQLFRVHIIIKRFLFISIVDFNEWEISHRKTEYDLWKWERRSTQKFPKRYRGYVKKMNEYYWFNFILNDTCSNSFDLE